MIYPSDSDDSLRDPSARKSIKPPYEVVVVLDQVPGRPYQVCFMLIWQMTCDLLMVAGCRRDDAYTEVHELGIAPRLTQDEVDAHGMRLVSDAVSHFQQENPNVH